jgi:hypothetical protein
LGEVEIMQRDHESEAQTAADTAALIRAYLANIRPLRGNCYCCDHEFWNGRCLIEGLARGYAAQMLPVWSLRACADVLHYLANAESIESRLDELNMPTLRTPIFSGFSGFHLLLQFAEDALRTVVTRPRKRASKRKRRRQAG